MANIYYKQNHLKKLRAFCQTAKLGSHQTLCESGSGNFDRDQRLHYRRRSHKIEGNTNRPIFS